MDTTSTTPPNTTTHTDLNTTTHTDLNTETPELVIETPELVIETPELVTSFIEQANNTQKKFGHNKFQIEIEQLKEEIEKWKLADREKDMKVNLFRKTIATLQSQLQEKSNAITSLEQSLVDHPNTGVITQLQSNQALVQEENVSLKSQLSKLQLEFDHQSQAHTLQQQELEHIQQSYKQSKAEAELLKTKLDQLNGELVSAQEQVTSLADQLKMNANLFDSTSSELQVVKQELAKFKTANEQLVNEHQTITQQLQETEQQLQKQLDAAANTPENNQSVTTTTNAAANVVRGIPVSRRMARRERRQG
ncbi:MAG: hypothetical protein EBU90_04215 [Proteobacteria bacterium]|nr:hypothetical protein [Pseudomonadota bacterium]NBP13902.1 hypothetical protein [bacterium]